MVRREKGAWKMIGLCYKDMICGKLRWTVLCVVLVCMLPIVVGYLVPETVLPSDNVSVLVLLFLGVGIVCAYGVLLGNVAQTVLDTDKGKNAEAYMRSLPSTASRYVYSKYIVLAAIFGLVTVGFAFAFWLLKGIGNDPGVQMLVSELLSAFPAVCGCCLVVLALELPICFRFGTEKGNQMRVAFIVFLFFGGMVYLLFGDLTVFDHWDAEHIYQFLERHPWIMKHGKGTVPVVSVVLYVLSARLSAWLYTKKNVGE